MNDEINIGQFVAGDAHIGTQVINVGDANDAKSFDELMQEKQNKSDAIRIEQGLGAIPRFVMLLLGLYSTFVWVPALMPAYLIKHPASSDLELAIAELMMMAIASVVCWLAWRKWQRSWPWGDLDTLDVLHGELRAIKAQLAKRAAKQPTLLLRRFAHWLMHPSRS